MIRATDLITEKSLMPGNPGTKKWVERFGKNLICIRYRYDPQRKMKIKTVELIVEEREWTESKTRIPANKLVSVRIKYGETHLGLLVKGAGGAWDRKKKVWILPYGEVKNLGLTHRMVR